MPRLASPIENIQDHYTVVVVGSGYGGAIAASRLARAGQQVCVLERGKEFQPGEYPNTEIAGIAETQVDTPLGHTGPRTGLYDIHVNEDIAVVLGCGLGGTSLINANVSLQANPRVFDDPHWPAELRADLPTRIADGYRRAEEMLKPAPYPANFPILPKLQALERSATHMGQRFYRPPINVTFTEGLNHVGVLQHACTLAGDCVMGCNYGAKNTTLMNYLPDAKNHGAEIYTEVAVRQVTREGDHWCVAYEPRGLGREGFAAPALAVTADIVILAAGALGSTEILLRSKAAGLPLSDAVGARFSGNGDVLGFGYDTDVPISGVGFGARRPGEVDPVGPCITGIIDMRDTEALDDGMVIEEGSIPGGLAPMLAAAFAAADAALGQEATGADAATRLRAGERVAESLIAGPYAGAVRNTQTYLVMAHDGAAGRMFLEDDRLRITWPGVGAQDIFTRINQNLAAATAPLGGSYVPNPSWTKLTHEALVSVHPLGGCVMAETADGGVVNHKGQVFAGASGDAVHAGLYVSDGSVVPRSVGVNPLLTISAITERCCAILAQEHGWQISYDLPSRPAAPAPPPALGVEFTETMRGYFSKAVLDDYAHGAAEGEKAGSPLDFTLTIVSEDLDALLTRPGHEARMVGTVNAPTLSPAPLTVTGGAFSLFVNDPDHPGTRLMRYRMPLLSREGRTFFLDGFKVVRDDGLLNVWRDTSTLYITLYDGASLDAPLLGKGLLKIRPDDFLRQMTTMQVRNAIDMAERADALARFGTFFAGVLFQTYGGVAIRPVAASQLADPAPPRAKRPLRAGTPMVHFFPADDGAELRLTRYKGGTKGPVILAHGLGVSSLIFAVDTVDTNLVEYLYAHGYDVWLLDYRASIDLPASAWKYTADDVARRDYPAAVAQVRALTGAPSVQVVAHCFGATTFLMAMLAGLEGVRSAVCSQVGLHPIPPTMGRIVCGLHLPSWLEALGVHSLSAYAGDHPNWQERLYDRAVALAPVPAAEHCDNAVCHRIAVTYGRLYDHARLNPATHSAMHEMFGIASVDVFEHLAAMVRAGHVVDAAGADVYLPKIARLAIPLRFIHGADNACWLPASTAATVDLLSKENGAALYSRNVVPDYGHIDCIFGQDAVRDVYPLILEHLEVTATAGAPVEATAHAGAV